MSSQIDLTVDTNPMADSIHTVTGHINGTTTAVVAMQAAVIAAEKEAADHVCDNVNRGFYTLIRSQISQKMAKLQSDVDSHLMQLNQQRKQLLALKNRMEHDYQMLSRRYTQLFGSINRNLEQRVYELDRPVMDFAGRDMDQVSNRSNSLTATVPVSQNETVRSSQRIMASNVKYRGLQVIGSIKNFLTQSMELDALTQKILLRRRMTSARETLLMPVMVCETRMDSADNRSVAIYVSEGVRENRTGSEIRNRVNAELPSMQWTQPQVPDPSLRSQFARLLDAAGLPERVRQYAMQLFNQSAFAKLSPNNGTQA